MNRQGSCYLIIKEKQKTLYKLPLHDGREYRIGRDPKAVDLVLEHARVSRRHCSIRYDEKKECIWVKDFSANGCSISGGVPLIQNVAVRVELYEEVLLVNTDFHIVVEKKEKMAPNALWFLFAIAFISSAVILTFFIKRNEKKGEVFPDYPEVIEDMEMAPTQMELPETVSAETELPDTELSGAEWSESELHETESVETESDKAASIEAKADTSDETFAVTIEHNETEERGDDHER